ncbi:hypothetical protein WA026_020890 [Henosepilachna vigintioctopunctata]|uniref:Uncharacterized protein n=1 Tax=Henosepilachna vigintioctopunctata TaxID=420089 RepID=A0AAW1UQW0_9CUCU
MNKRLSFIFTYIRPTISPVLPYFFLNGGQDFVIMTLMRLCFVPSFANLSACSFPGMLVCLGIQINVNFHPRFLISFMRSLVNIMISSMCTLIFLLLILSNALKESVNMMDFLMFSSLMTFSAIIIAASSDVHIEKLPGRLPDNLMFRSRQYIPNTIFPPFCGSEASVYSVVYS